MKFERIIWGVLLLFIGGILLLTNLDVINFYWRNVLSFWPIFLIIAGINLLLNRNGSQLGSIISLVVLVITLCFLFFKGQERPANSIFSNKWGFNKDIEDFEDFEEAFADNYSKENVRFHESYEAADAGKSNTVNIKGGGADFSLDGISDDLFEADVEDKKGNFALNKIATDTSNVLDFKVGNHKVWKKSWNFGSTAKKVNFKMNDAPTWKMNLAIGAGEVDFDLVPFKVRTLNFDGGAASIKLKIGDLLPITDVNIKTGVANVEIKVPSGSGCQITTHTGLSSKEFKGFTKIKDNVYQSPNYASSTHKIFIKLDGGLANFEVETF